MSYEIIDPRRVPKSEFIQSLAKIANRAWHGYRPAIPGRTKADYSDSFSWRHTYYSTLMDNWDIAQRSFRITAFLDERTGKIDDCAFITVLPMQPDACRLHRRGVLSQYEFSTDDFRISRSHTEKSFHYIQSLFCERIHHQSFILKKMMKECAFSLLRSQYCGFHGRPYEIYAETSMKNGRKLALNHGFIESGESSHEGRPFFVLDDKTQNTKIANHIRQLWGSTSALATIRTAAVRPPVSNFS
jgi:hypothetical protein